MRSRPAAAKRLGPFDLGREVMRLSTPSPRLPGEARKSARERHRDLLPAAQDGDPPLPAAGAGDALQIGWLVDLLVVHRDHDIALLEADRPSARALSDIGNDDAF